MVFVGARWVLWQDAVKISGFASVCDSLGSIANTSFRDEVFPSVVFG